MLKHAYSLLLLEQRRLCSRIAMGEVSRQITTKLTARLEPQHLEVINESHMHSVPRDSETHFKVVVVCDLFKSLTLLNRHKLVNEILSDELKSGVHALSIVAKTPEQWDKNNVVEGSPSCMGGFGK